MHMAAPSSTGQNISPYSRYMLKSVTTVSQTLSGHLEQSDIYLSAVSNDSITCTHPDRKLGILCMKNFAGVGGVNKLLNEASPSEFIMKISEQLENYCDLTCRPATHTRTHAQRRMIS